MLTALIDYFLVPDSMTNELDARMESWERGYAQGREAGVRTERARLREKVEAMTRYECVDAPTFNENGDTYATMESDKKGEWISRADVLALLSEDANG